MGLKIKPRNTILHEIITDAKHYPENWNATFGRDHDLLSYDCYISHPDVGVYLLKEHLKNPFETQGVGAKIARHLDDDIQKTIQKNTGQFGIVQGNIQKILNNIQHGIPPEMILEAALKGNDLGLRIPLKGRATQSKNTFTVVHNNFAKQRKQLDTKFEKLMIDEGAYNSYS